MTTSKLTKAELLAKIALLESEVEAKQRELDAHQVAERPSRRVLPAGASVIERRGQCTVKRWMPAQR